MAIRLPSKKKKKELVAIKLAPNEKKEFKKKNYLVATRWSLFRVETTWWPSSF
jgi:hypothetical protein